MPTTPNVIIKVGNRDLDMSPLDKERLNLNYVLEYPENFEKKQSSYSQGITVPATPGNSQVFGGYANPTRVDTSPGEQHKSYQPAEIIVNGVTIMKGRALLQEAGHTDLPEDFVFNIFGDNADWAVDARNLTLWDCVNDNPHVFSVANVIRSWRRYFQGDTPGSTNNGFDSDEDHDYVYAPVRYRQPFGPNDDKISIYHLRPSISVYWLLVRGFRQLGYRFKSTFFETDYFRGLVMPWTFGDFYDITGTVVETIGFKALGSPEPPTPPVGSYTADLYYTGNTLQTESFNTMWTLGMAGGAVTPDIDFGYDSAHPRRFHIRSYTGTDSFSRLVYANFNIANTAAPNGRDNFGLYFFDTSTGGMQFLFAPPPYIARTLTGSVTLGFTLKLHYKLDGSGTGAYARLYYEITRTRSFYPSILATTLIDGVSNGIIDNVIAGKVVNIYIPGCELNDIISIRLVGEHSSPASRPIKVASSLWVNTGSTGTPAWTIKQYTTLELTSIQIDLGGDVNFKWYDAFKRYPFLDLFRGLIDMFDLVVQTNPVLREITIEPMFPQRVTAPGRADQDTDGYFKDMYVWDDKQDLSKRSSMELFSNYERQVDFMFRQDGSDGAQNIWSARYKGIYLNNTVTSRLKYDTVDNGVYAGVPGAARYMLPERFNMGNRQRTNRFFSATMHYFATQFKYLTGVSPQLIAIFPENIANASAEAVQTVFEPKIAYYEGLADRAVHGGWYWEGDPSDPSTAYDDYDLPLMYSVYYGSGGDERPVLTYSDQLIQGNKVKGLLKKFLWRRMAMFANGQIYHTHIKLGLLDMANWTHRQIIRLKNCNWGIIEIDGFNPLSDESTKVTMYKLVLPDATDIENIYPSEDALDSNALLSDPFDLVYAPLLIFPNDIPGI